MGKRAGKETGIDWPALGEQGKEAIDAAFKSLLGPHTYWNIEKEATLKFILKAMGNLEDALRFLAQDYGMPKLAALSHKKDSLIAYIAYEKYQQEQQEVAKKGKPKRGRGRRGK